ncbi:UDP-N-acetylmuramoyl-L-alanyl-D-glutamate--2,6-diaminopimelate ligase [Crenothrix sp.]|uniref:UDP-N-acetylmuramoyl-L-alanyl-D-glutamate--2, 6-diaminopimelate ligase n=1 Tax=Crenothrix sp. TaxID=3100433 RepID=UPI00374C8F50
MKLNALLSAWVGGESDIDVTGLALDSRKVIFGHVFIALAGFNQHGLLYAQQAIDQGACAIVYDPAENGLTLAAKIKGLPLIAIVDLGLKLGEIASRFYGFPSQKIDVIGITGTNGKTSCSHFLSQLLDDCAIIGTLGWGERGALRETINTTPDALSVQQMLFELLGNDKKTVAMEVSSHALAQGRVNGICFKGVVFTNISRDHLDYHGTMDAYLQAKLILLDKPGIGFAVVNLDDPYVNKVIARIPGSVMTWGISATGRILPGMECVWVKDMYHDAEGIGFTVNWRTNAQAIHVPLYGDFNVENILATLAVSLAMGSDLIGLAHKLHFIKPVAGRMEPLGGGLLPLVFVDYAHTPDALEKVLASVRKHCQGDLWVVFGCGGNRDTGKRSQMGNIAEQWADYVIVTDDNPRFEASSAIVEDIIQACQSNKIQAIQNRKDAIHQAVINATAIDCIVVAGKGHETYQEIEGVRMPFSDRQVVMDALNMRLVNL